MASIVGATALVLLAAGPARTGNAAASDMDDVLGLIRAARGTFRVTVPSDVAQARVDAVEKMNALGRSLDAWGENGWAWKEYLLWDQLTAQLAGMVPADAAELAALLDRFVQGHDGLERHEFMQLRGALSRFYYRSLALDDEEQATEFVQRIDQLGELVEALHSNPDTELLNKISQHLTWLGQREQVPELVLAVRDLAPAANVRLTLSDEFITHASREPVDRVDPLTDQVLGTTVHGTSHLLGTMAAFPVADGREARLEARLHGEADTAGRGYNGPVRANVVGTASVQATGEILFGPQGFHVGTTSAQVSATGRPTQLWTTCKSRLVNGLITCVARRRANKTQQLGDCIASRHAETRLEQQVGEELQVRVDKLQDGYLTRFRNPLLRYETFPRTFQAASQAQDARVDMLLASATQTGALESPPDSDLEAPLHALVHETAFNNLAASVLAGRSVSEVELREFMGRLFGDEAEPVRIADRDVLQIVLADQRPLTCHLGASTITITIRADRFIRSRTKYASMNMTVRYKIERDGNTFVLTRASEPEIVPRDFEETGRRRLGAREVSARRFIAAMLNRELAQSYRLGAISPPEQSGIEGKLSLTHLVTSGGWLDVGVQPSSEQ